MNHLPTINFQVKFHLPTINFQGIFVRFHFHVLLWFPENGWLEDEMFLFGMSWPIFREVIKTNDVLFSIGT